MTDHPREDWQALVEVSSEFEAQILQTSLGAAGIEAKAGAAGDTSLVLVRSADVDAARRVLQENRDEFAQLDWDQLDDRAPGEVIRTRRSMPLPARIAFLVTALVMLVTLIALVIAVFV